MNVVILAAGMGKRMQSALPKVLHPLAGKPLLSHVLDTARRLSASRLCVIYGHGGAAVVQDVGHRHGVSLALEHDVKQVGRHAHAAAGDHGHRNLGRDGAHPLGAFSKTITVNLIGTFNMIRLAADAMAKAGPNAAGERGVETRVLRPDRMLGPDLRGHRNVEAPERVERGIGAEAATTLARSTGEAAGA